MELLLRVFSELHRKRKKKEKDCLGYIVKIQEIFKFKTRGYAKKLKW